MRNAGWIKLHRKILNNPLVCKDTEYYCVWNYLLLNASHDGVETLFGGKRIRLSSGQLVTSRKQIAEFWGISDSKVERVLKALEIEHQIEQQSSSKNRLITVLNWQEYQNSEQQDEQRLNSNRTASEQHKEQECNNDKNNIYIVSDETIRQADAAQRALEEWNAQSGVTGISPVSRLTAESTRYKMLLARIREYGIDDVVKAIRKIGDSSFLRGGGNKGWIITFDWFVRPNNFVKVLEGQYDDRNKRADKQQAAIEEW